MSINQPKNLETDFNKLSINPQWKKLPPNHNHGCNFCKVSRKEYSFKNILVAPKCTCKISKKQRHKSLIVRPAKLNLLTTDRKNFKPILKPPTLHLSSDKNKTSKTNTSKSSVSQQSATTSVDSKGKVFTNGENDSQNSFKALLPNSDTDILKAFDTLSFKELRPQVKSRCAADGSSSSSKRENNSSNSCSVQARMRPSLYTDCDDTSIEELASYFDLFVHIPKKMSTMAEMMYI